MAANLRVAGARGEDSPQSGGRSPRPDQASEQAVTAAEADDRDGRVPGEAAEAEAEVSEGSTVDSDTDYSDLRLGEGACCGYGGGGAGGGGARQRPDSVQTASRQRPDSVQTASRQQNRSV